MVKAEIYRRIIIDTVMRLYEKGLSQRSIAHQCTISETTVKRILKESFKFNDKHQIQIINSQPIISPSYHTEAMTKEVNK